MFVHLSRWLTMLLLLAVACGLYRAAYSRPQSAPLAPVRNHPWPILPRVNDPRVVTDVQLRAVLARVRLGAAAPNTNNIIHALRLWGLAADFRDPTYLSGRQMRDYLIDDARFRELAGADAPPLLSLRDDGVGVRPFEDGAGDAGTGAVHTDDLLATLAEIGTPLDQPLVARNGRTTVGRLLAGALGRFHLTQIEPEWSAISYARYFFPATEWRNRFGQRITVDQLVDELIAPPLREGVCAGTHRLEALTVLYRADEQAHVLPPRTRRRILNHLGQASALLVASQDPQGFWTKSWPTPGAPADARSATLADRILATGHHLEWLALAPAEVQPPREAIVRAAQWLVVAMLEVDPPTLKLEYGPFSHAARALCLWRGREPFDAWRAGEPSGSGNRRS